MTAFEIRKADLSDASVIAELSCQLGYSLSIFEIEDHLTIILQDETHFVYVALKDSIVVGYVHCFKAIRLTSPPFMEIAALIVNEKERGKGIGRLLVKACEEHSNWPIRVRCNVKRELTHQFYTQLDYKEVKEQKVFEKKN